MFVHGKQRQHNERQPSKGAEIVNIFCAQTCQTSSSHSMRNRSPDHGEPRALFLGQHFEAGQRPSHPQLPKPGLWQKETRDGVAPNRPNIEQERNQDQQQDDREQVAPYAPKRPEQKGIGQIELLFDP